MGYRVGWPLWKIVLRVSGSIDFRVEVLEDVEAGVFVARSPDIKGLIAEAPSIHQLKHEVEVLAIDLISHQCSLDGGFMNVTEGDLRPDLRFVTQVA